MSKVPFDIWRTGGITEHLGGVAATRRLLALCSPKPGQRVLDIGCGTGYTACLLARTYGAEVTVLDRLVDNVARTQRRVHKTGVTAQVTGVHADAHTLPFTDEHFDLVIAESVLIFCNAPRVVAEIRRVLKPSGVYGANELTLLQLPPAELQALLTDTLGIRAFQELEWRAILDTAGLTPVATVAQKVNLWEQLAGHIQVDGVTGYLTAMVKGLANLRISRAFINRQMLKAARQFLPMVGYGLFVGKNSLEG
jgi:SAM-dependent methyltransferase